MNGCLKLNIYLKTIDSCFQILFAYLNILWHFLVS